MKREHWWGWRESNYGWMPQELLASTIKPELCGEAWFNVILNGEASTAADKPEQQGVIWTPADAGVAEAMMSILFY